MRKIMTGLFVLALAGALAAPASAEIVERQFARPGGKITFDLESGGDVIIHGGGSGVSITADLRGRSRADYEVTMEETGGGVLVRSKRINRSRSSSTDFEFTVSVPARFDVHVETTGGSISIDGVEGEFTGETAGGNVTLRDVRGRADLKTMGGNVRLEEAELDGRISTMGGNLNLRDVMGDLETKTMGGNVDLADVSGNVKTKTMGGNVTHTGGGRGGGSRVELETMGGNVRVGEAVAGADVSTMGGNIDVKMAGDSLKAKTMGGNITVGEMDGWIDAETYGGNVTVNVVEGPHGSRRDVQISSKGGDIELHVPDGFSMNVEIELAYTKNSSQDFEIVSDFPLQYSESPDWERGEGTPRKYLYGKGSVAGGAHTVRIRTINGDVKLLKGSR